VIVAALGYFVDVYDLVLFLIVGKKSLLDLLGNGKAEWILEKFQFLLDVQMIGMLIGGVLWGIIGDFKGRLSVLFGSIIMYSVANLLNAFVYDIASYTVLRFIAGLGLAGELGAGITLVSEIMSKENRGYGTMIVASVGVLGAVVAGLTANLLGWRITYLIGGFLGLLLLLLRISTFESSIFEKNKHQNISRGISLFLKDQKLLLKLFFCVAIGFPVWFIIGIFVGRAPEIAKMLHVNGIIEQSYCVSLCYTGLVFGDLSSGALSQYLRSRKKVLLVFYLLSMSLVFIYIHAYQVSSQLFYALIFGLGFSVGFWAIFVTIASEQFGTNVRATATTTVPNLVRGSLVPIALIFDFLRKNYNFWTATYLTTAIVFAFTLWAWYNLKETFGKDLDYNEKVL
jgi:MFS family permease